MEIKEFINDFADQFDDIDKTDLTADMDFRDIEGWSSIYSLAIIAMVDEKYDVKIKGDDLKKSQTINDLYEIVKSRM